MRKTQHGFTLVELLTAIGIIALLAAIATPMLRQFSASSRVTATNNSLVSALATARMEALRRSMPVTVCSSTDGQTCGGAADWVSGWIVFTDSNANGAVDAATDRVLQAWSAPGTNVTASPNPTKFVTYNSRGMTNLPAITTFNAWVTGCRGNNQTNLTVTVAGSPQSTRIACP